MPPFMTQSFRERRSANPRRRSHPVPSTLSAILRAATPGCCRQVEIVWCQPLAQGKLPLCAEICSTKSLLAGDGDIIAEITHVAA
jgi:hypothetical protein